jgi:hypothetical protein
MSTPPEVSFERVFPVVRDIEVEVEQMGRPWRTTRNVWKGPHWPERHVNCQNRLCVRGGFALWEVLGRMISQRKAEDEGERLCQGYEGSPGGRRKYGVCPNIFKYKIRIEYRETPDREPND